MPSGQRESKLPGIHCVELPVPKDIRGVRSFLGLATYYRRFIRNFSKIVNPLFRLTQKDVAFDWNDEVQKAWEKLLTVAPVLSFPNFGRGFLLETDASGLGLGAVLARKKTEGTVSPIAYASQTLQKHERNYGSTELEALAVVWATKHFRHYLYGHQCVVFTDHEALKALLNTPQPSGKLARWGLALQELDLQICYCPGKQNQNADVLSRNPVPMETENEELETIAVVAGQESKQLSAGS